MAVKIQNSQIDVCPLCNKQIEPNGSPGTRVVLGGEILFYAHKDCIGTLNKFLTQVRRRL